MGMETGGHMSTLKIRFGTRPAARLTVFLVILLTVCGLALAYDNYSVSRTDGKCATCHGGFRASPYTSLSDGISWEDDMHDVHRRTMLDSDCDACHDPSRFPDPIATSNGGTGWPAIGCVGCHGRAEDGTGNGTEGYGAGLRQHHYLAGETVCLDCHADSDPAAMTPAGEDVLPPYYASVGNHVGQPTDSCNPNLTEENYAGSTIGLDNDGDGSYDMADAECSGVVAGPGESSGSTLLPLLVTAHDVAGPTMTLSFEAACSVSDSNIEWGPLGQVSSYAYGTQTANECGVGTGASYVWSYPTVQANLFFLIVGNDGAIEGSLGLDGGGNERPEGAGGICDVPQDLTNRCD